MSRDEPPADEFALIERIRTRATASDRVALGIGDDAAVVRVSGGNAVVAADLVAEGTHFTLEARPGCGPPATPELVGRKALAVNLSDLAAMASRPTAAFVTLAVRRGLGGDFADRVMLGMQALAAEFDVAIAGGDTAVVDGPVVISVTLLGEPTLPDGRVVMRSGARPNDVLFVTGPLGGSLASGRHLTFTPRVAWAIDAASRCEIHAMLDVSDGLFADLDHLCRASGVGAEVDRDKVPLNSDAGAFDEAVRDGEDFELLLAAPPASADALRHAGAIEIGRVVEVGRDARPSAEGYRHGFGSR